jgi:hypothetical protein
MSSNFHRQDPRALSIKEGAEACGSSRATPYRVIVGRKLATVKSTLLVPVVAIDAPF